MGTKTTNADLTGQVKDSQGKIPRGTAQQRIDGVLGTCKRYLRPSLSLPRIKVKMTSVVIGKKPPKMAPKASGTASQCWLMGSFLFSSSEDDDSLRYGLVIYKRSPKLTPPHPLLKHMDKILGGNTRDDAGNKKKLSIDNKQSFVMLDSELSSAEESDELTSASVTSPTRVRSRGHAKKQAAAASKVRRGRK